MVFVLPPSDGGWHSGTVVEIADRFVSELRVLLSQQSDMNKRSLWPDVVHTVSCRHGERTAPHAHQRWAGAALQPDEYHTTGEGCGKSVKGRERQIWHQGVNFRVPRKWNMLHLVLKCWTVTWFCQNWLKINQVNSHDILFGFDSFIDNCFFPPTHARVAQSNQGFSRVEIWTV